MAAAGPEVSVVVPAYNVARYLPRCLDSLAAQTLADLEVILVDDGSTDGTRDVLRDYAGRVPTFRLLEQENRGYSGARNAGLAIATGTYVGFVDADDWVEPEMFEHLVSLAGEKGADIAQCGFSWYLEEDARHEIRDNSWIPPLLERTHGRLRGAEAILFEDIAIWKKIYRRSLLQEHGLRFDESMPMGEDAPFHLTALCLARTIAASDRVCYHYRKQREGQQTAIRDERLLAYFQIVPAVERNLPDADVRRLRPWLLHLQLSRHCWGYEMAAPAVRETYFRTLQETFRRAGYTARDPIAAGCWRHGRLSSRVRWLSLRVLHPAALRAILGGDRDGFDRIIRLRTALQDPSGELRRLRGARKPLRPPSRPPRAAFSETTHPAKDEPR